jgi:HD-GYP domain-containing protein (c-di-GMP phosphodiesterase class II)
MDTDWLLSILAREHEIANTSQLDDLLERMLGLMIEVCAAQGGVLFLLDRETGELVLQATNPRTDGCLAGAQRLRVGTEAARVAMQSPAPILVDDPASVSHDGYEFNRLLGLTVKNYVSIPMHAQNGPIGLVQVLNCQRVELQIARFLGNRLASEVERTMVLQASRERSERLQVLVDIIGRISSSLDRDQILQMIVDYSCQLLNTEAGSLFLLDEKTGDLEMHTAASQQGWQLGQVRVPAGKGIIGYTIRTGETVLIPDVQVDQRFYQEIDRLSGFETRSVLAVPLRAHRVILGGGQGVTEERIIGGLEAVNKRDGLFNREDALLLETLANQAATVLQIANLYANTNDLFMGIIRAITAAIDAKDPSTEGHSQRVSDFSAAIAHELNLAPQVVHHIRLGGLLHDVGKIGVPDAILQKPGRLTANEYEQIKRHPLVGKNILVEVPQLELELPGIAEHHERVDGTGYPGGLQGDLISLPGRIVAVADVFDALTSERPYRAARTTPEAFARLTEGIGKQFDGRCVDALKRAYQKGLILTQKDREQV